MGSMDPAFSASTWVARSGLAASTAHLRRGMAKKCLDSLPQSPAAPLSLSMVVSCWHGEPPTIRTMAP
eukprot:2615780-Heterocapsa_arctica.AAC.1